MAKDVKPKKLYQVWKGSNRFFCGGRLIFGPDVASLFLSILLVLGPAIAFCIKTYCKIVDKDTVRPAQWYPVLIVACILTILRNYRFFFMFISTATILCVYVFVFSWIYILDGGYKIGKAITEEIIADFLIVYCFVAVWFVGGLTVFHSYLICTNQTTYENFRNRYDKKENPFNRGITRNVKEIFFTKIPPSMNKFRSVVKEEEHMAVGSLTPNLVEALASSKEKIDIEMGAKSAEDGNLTLPEILQNLDFDDNSEDSPDKIDGEERSAFGEEEEKDCGRISMAQDELNECIQASNAIEEQEKFVLDPIAGDRGRESAIDSSLDALATETTRSSNCDQGVEDTIMNSFAGGDNNTEEGLRDACNSHKMTAAVLQA